jgi:hypothetical protein
MRQNKMRMNFKVPRRDPIVALILMVDPMGNGKESFTDGEEPIDAVAYLVKNIIIQSTRKANI